MKLIKLILYLNLLFNLNILYSQIESIEEKDFQIEHYKYYKEHFYKEDEPIQKIEDIKSESSFYLVKRNSKNKIINVGFYLRKTDELNRSRLILTENVNEENLPYYYIIYSYNEDNKLIRKEYKNKYDKLLAYKKYIWNDKKKELKKVERWSESDFLGKMKLKSFNEYQWEGDKLRTFSYFNEEFKLIEKYYFIQNPNTGENIDSINLVGNHKISLFVLSKYERFRTTSENRERLFYVIYEKSDNNYIIPKTYNHDEVLIQESPPIQEKENSEELIPIEE